MTVNADLFKTNVPLLFAHFRDRLKSQAKALSRLLSLTHSKSYELIATMWGFDDWFHMNRFLKAMEQLHVDMLLLWEHANDNDNDNDERLIRVAGKLEVLTAFVEDFEGGTYSRRYPEGIYKAIVHEQNRLELESPLSDVEEGIAWDVIMRGEKDYIELFNSIASRTAWLRDRKIFCNSFIDDVIGQTEYAGQFKKGLSQFNLPDTDPALSWKMNTLVSAMFGTPDWPVTFEEYIGTKFGDDLNDGYMAVEPMQEMLIYQSMELNKVYHITVKDLCEQLAFAESQQLDWRSENFTSIGLAAAHLPDDALVSMYIYERGQPIVINSISVRSEADVPRLLACISTNRLENYEIEEDALIFGTNGNLMKEYLGGYTAFGE